MINQVVSLVTVVGQRTAGWVVAVYCILDLLPCACLVEPRLIANNQQTTILLGSRHSFSLIRSSRSSLISSYLGFCFCYLPLGSLFYYSFLVFVSNPKLFFLLMKHVMACPQKNTKIAKMRRKLPTRMVTNAGHQDWRICIRIH